MMITKFCAGALFAFRDRALQTPPHAIQAVTQAHTITIIIRGGSSTFAQTDLFIPIWYVMGPRQRIWMLCANTHIQQHHTHHHQLRRAAYAVPPRHITLTGLPREHGPYVFHQRARTRRVFIARRWCTREIARGEIRRRRFPSSSSTGFLWVNLLLRGGCPHDRWWLNMRNHATFRVMSAFMYASVWVCASLLRIVRTNGHCAHIAPHAEQGCSTHTHTLLLMEDKLSGSWIAMGIPIAHHHHQHQCQQVASFLYTI